MVDAPGITSGRAGTLFDSTLDRGGSCARSMTATMIATTRSPRYERWPAALVMAMASILVAGACGDQVAPQSLSREQLMDPASCKQCHDKTYNEWAGSMHAYASRDPVFLAMNRRGQEETQGALGSLCVNCHAPLAVRTGATINGLNLPDLPASVQGVGCYFCHNVDAVTGTHNNPLHLANDRTMRARITDPVPNSAHASAASSLFSGANADSATLCGSCHDIALPVPPAPAEVALERTFQEWTTSVFAPAQAPSPSAVATCNACHMPFAGTEEPIAEGPGLKVVARNRHPHQMAGVDTAFDGFPYSADPAEDDALRADQRDQIQRMLDVTLRLEICVQAISTEASVIQVTLDNANAGHNWPSGASQDRRAWVEVIATRNGQPLYQSGVVPDDQAVTSSPDPDLWLFRDQAFDAQDKETHMFWQVARYVPGTIGAQVTNNPADSRYYTGSHAIRRFPLDKSSYVPGVPDRVTVRVRIRAMDFDLLDDLIASGHLDPVARASVRTFDLLPNRALAAPQRPQFASLAHVSLEWSDTTRTAGVFYARQDFTERPPRDCIGMPRQP
jgi:hypothetical protein